MPYDFYQNRDCEYFPCHANADPDTFSCLFCYCPLYALGDTCGGNFTYTETGIKDCSNCLRPHKRECYNQITEKLGDIIKMVQQRKHLEHKSIFFDTNATNPDGSYHVSELEIKRHKLTAGDLVTAYQDNEKWTAEVVFRNNRWGIELISEADQISSDHYKGHKEGFHEGKLQEEQIIMCILKQLNIPAKTVETIKQELDRIHE